MDFGHKKDLQRKLLPRNFCGKSVVENVSDREYVGNLSVICRVGKMSGICRVEHMMVRNLSANCRVGNISEIYRGFVGPKICHLENGPLSGPTAGISRKLFPMSCRRS